MNKGLMKVESIGFTSLHIDRTTKKEEMSEQINENKKDVQRKSMSYLELSQKKYTKCGRVPIRSSNREPFRVGVAKKKRKISEAIERN